MVSTIGKDKSPEFGSSALGGVFSVDWMKKYGVSVYSRLSLYIYIYLYLYISIYIYIYLYISIYIYIYLYISIYIYIYIYRAHCSILFYCILQPYIVCPSSRAAIMPLWW